MELQYEATIEDVCEPQVRHYLRSRSYQRQRWLEPIWGGVGAVIALYFITVFTRELSIPVWIYPLAFALGWLCILLTIRDTVSKRICRHLAREVGHKLPSTTKYSILDTKLQCSSLGANTTFDLKDLSAVSEDSERLELKFGDIGLCTIPLRVFQDDDHKKSFLESLKRENTTLHPTAGSVLL
jgi:hypothetical protein